jgi:hypothetical protein
MRTEVRYSISRLLFDFASQIARKDFSEVNGELLQEWENSLTFIKNEIEVLEKKKPPVETLVYIATISITFLSY